MPMHSLFDEPTDPNTDLAVTNLPGSRDLAHIYSVPRTLAEVVLNAASQVELKVKTPWRDGTTHIFLPLEFGQRLIAPVAAAQRPWSASCCRSRWPGGTAPACEQSIGSERLIVLREAIARRVAIWLVVRPALLNESAFNRPTQHGPVCRKRRTKGALVPTVVTGGCEMLDST